MKMLRDCAKLLKVSQTRWRVRLRLPQRLHFDSLFLSLPRRVSLPPPFLNNARALLRLAQRMLLPLALLACAACAAQDPATADATTMRRVIVTFRGDADPRDAAFRAQLASAARVHAITLLREMSGHAWVMSLSCRDDRARDCDDALQRLRATPWIATIEFDGRER